MVGRGKSSQQPTCVIDTDVMSLARSGTISTTSGLVQNWKKHTERGSKHSGPEPVGGLNDRDAYAKKPKFKSSKQGSTGSTRNIKFDGTQDFSCKNQVSTDWKHCMYVLRPIIL